MPRGYRFRFYPTIEQEHLLAPTFGCVRYVYNWALRHRTEAWHQGKRQRNPTMAKPGRLDVNWNRAFTSEPSTVTLSKDAAGRFFVSLRLDEPVKQWPEATARVGIDLGIHRTMPLSDGTRIGNPLEDLWVRNLMANRCLSKAIGDGGWHELTRQLTYKAERQGRTVVKIDRFFPSSKRCSGCGHIEREMPLDVRRWQCPDCSVEHDRDENAAKNILAAGQAVAAFGGTVRPKRVPTRRGTSLRKRNRPKTVSES